MEAPIEAVGRIPAGVLQRKAQGASGRARPLLHRVLLLILVGTVALAAPALAKSTCSGPLKKSCLRKLYQCFNAKGTCMTQDQLGVGSSTATSCWINGAKLIFELGAPTQGAGMTVRNGQVTTKSSKGKACFTGSVTLATDETAPFGTTTTWTVSRKKKTWQLVTDTTGAFNVTCPNGKVEMYTVEQLGTLAAQCGGTGGACSPGACP